MSGNIGNAYIRLCNKLMNKLEILKQIDDLWKIFEQVRATYPSVHPTLVGHTHIKSPQYYEDKGLNFTILFEKPLTREDIERRNGVAHWINQSVLIRLYALLEYYDIVSKTKSIGTNLDGHEEIEMLRRLRNFFVHTGRYNKADKDQKVLFDRIVNHFGLSVQEEEDFPIPIDSVIEIIFEKTKTYVRQI